jgi:hypothetical protein
MFKILLVLGFIYCSYIFILSLVIVAHSKYLLDKEGFGVTIEWELGMLYQMLLLLIKKNPLDTVFNGGLLVSDLIDYLVREGKQQVNKC